MHFLGFYHLTAALAVIGVCASTGAMADDFNFQNDFDNTAYVANINPNGGGERLPPPAYVINTPPAYVDNGYNPNYAWNRAHGYTPYYGPPIYAPLPPGYWAYYAQARVPNSADNDGGYGGRSHGATYSAHRWHHPRGHHPHEPAGETRMPDGAPPAAHWQPAVQVETPPPPPKRQSARGYNGHDASMFEGPRP